MKKIVLLIAVAISVFSCFKSDERKPLVVSSIPVWKSVAKYIGGGDFRYFSVIKGGESPHGYEPKPTDVKKLQEASLVVVHGLGLDDWAVRNVSKSKVLNLGELFEKKYPFIKKPGYHIWMNPVLMEDVYFEVANRLVKFYPNRQTYYNKRAEDYAAMIDQLLDRISKCLGDAKRSTVVIYHPVWEPLLKTFGMDVIKVTRTPEEQITAARLKEVIKKAREKHAKLVIGETFADRKVPELIAKEVGAKVLIMNPLPDEDYVIALSHWGEEICNALKEQ